MSQPSDEVPTKRDTAIRAFKEAGMAAPWYVKVVAAPVFAIMEDTQKRRVARLEASVGEVADGVGGPEALTAALADAENEVQFVQAMEAAVRSGQEAKRRLLVRAVVNSINDDAKFDESQMVIDALTELNTMHIRALVALDDELDEEGDWKLPLRFGADGAVLPEDAERGHGQSPVWDALPGPVKATLIRSGTCTGPSPSFGLRYGPEKSPRPIDGISDFGRMLLRELRAEASETP